MELLLHQPPAGLPDLRQGRRVPAAEPGDEHRAARTPGSSTRSARSPSRSRSPRRCCWTASAACCASAAPASPSRSPATRSSTCSSAARCSRSASAPDKPFQSYFSGNTIQICPVGALTSAAYRFRSRPFDLVSTAERLRALRVRLRDAHRLPPRHRDAPAGRQRPRGQRGVDRRQGPVRLPLPDRGGPDHPAAGARRATACCAETSWTDALQVAAEGLLAGARGRDRRARRRPADGRGRLRLREVRPGRRWHATTSTSGPARTAPRSWTSSPRTSSGTAPGAARATPASRRRPPVLCVALEPEEEAPVVFLRLRKAAQKHRQKVFHLGQWTTPAVLRTAVERGLAEPAARDGLIRAVPGAEAAVLAGPRRGRPARGRGADGRRRDPRRRAGRRGARACYSAVARLAERTGAAVGWVPRRAGRARRGRGRRAAHAAARRPPGDRRRRARRGRAGLGAGRRARCPATPGRDTAEMLTAAAVGELAALVVGGVDPYDLPDPVARPGRRCARSGSW